MDLIISLCAKIEKSISLDKQCALVFFQLAFQLLARKSELIFFKDNPYLLKVEHVNFTFIQLSPIIGEEFNVTCIEAHKFYINAAYDLHSVQIEIKDAKNDQQGNSHRYSFDKRPSGYNNLKTFCIARTTFTWAVLSKPCRPRQLFLSFPIENQNDTSKRTYPSEDLLRNLLKDEASFYGLDLKRVTLHSPRIGAATTLAVMGAADYIIKGAGRWASDCFQR